jgi:D-aminopeptidase
VGSNGSGDYVIAFSTHQGVRRSPDARRLPLTELANDEMTRLFQAAVEATEEAIYNSLLAASTVTAKGGAVEALPVGDVVKILERHRALRH